MNTKEFEAGEIRGTLYGKEGAHTIIYILEPIPVTCKVSSLAEEYPVVLCALSGMNWNRDLSPWTAKKVFKGEDDFGGKGDAFIETLVNDVFPKAESMAPSVSRRMMAGISMSGLFSLYMATKYEKLEGIASISGSLWFPRLRDYMKDNLPLNKDMRIYLSLGNKEKKVRNPLMAKVEEETFAIRDLLASSRRHVIYQENEGNHFVHGEERLKEALLYLITGEIWQGSHSVK